MLVASLKDVSVHFGTDTVLDHANLNIEKGERLCLAGRNGSGKSTLMRLLDGRVAADGGEVWVSEGHTCATLEQELPTKEGSIYEAVAGAFDDIGAALVEYHRLSQSALSDKDVDRLAKLQSIIEAQDGWTIRHRVESTLQKMRLEPEQLLSTLSGGWLKRVAIARSLVLEPDIWLLDEPTNHLDIPTIVWLQSVMLDFAGTIIFVSHDRELMQAVGTSMVEIDRGKLKRWDCDYQSFLVRRDHDREVEMQHNQKFDERLKKEEAWIREGIKARRTRNEGRVRALEKLREERSARRTNGKLKLEVDSGNSSGKIVKELKSVSKSLGGKTLIKDLDLIVQRGDRVGLLGPNGVGKTTLINLILGNIEPDSGEIKTGTRWTVAYFDQTRGQLNPEMSVKDYIGDGRDYVTINGRDTHVMSYLANFMFDADQVRSPIAKLSGGEQNRLLLAHLFSMPTNFLVLDEPTNDLDVESLELLEELLLGYEGTVLLVSHDRSFLDNVVSGLLVFQGQGQVTEYVGGYTDWQQQNATKKQPEGSNSTSDSAGLDGPKPDFEARRKLKSQRQKLQRELDKIPQEIDELESLIVSIHKEMNEVQFYSLDTIAQQKVFDRLAKNEADLLSKMSRWEEIEEELAALPDI